MKSITYYTKAQKLIRSAFWLVFFATGTPTGAQQIIKIQASPLKVINEGIYGNPQVLFDEQNAAGDPLHGLGGIINNNDAWNFANPTLPKLPLNTWECGYTADAYPSTAYIDLGRPYVVTNIYLRDVNDNGEFSVNKGYPGTWKLLFTDLCKGYNSWNAHTLSGDTTRYLRFKMKSGGAKITEVVVYGYDLYPANGDTVAPAAIQDLKIDSISASQAYLSWTAPGDNGTEGKAHFYELRYSKTPITAKNFLTGAKVDYICKPLIAGTKTSFTVNGLQSGSPYYFAIISRDSLLNPSALSNVPFSYTKYVLNCNPYRIIIEPQMVTNEYALGDASKLADEQSIEMDTAKNTTSKCLNRWITPNTNWYYPIYAMIDLGTLYNLSKFCVYNSASPYFYGGPLELFYGSPNHWQSMCNDSMKIREKWTSNEVNVQTRYLRIKLKNPDVRIGELALFGSPVQLPAAKTEPTVAIPQKPLLKDFIGVNTLINEPIGRTQCAGFVREYHEWCWNESNSNYPGYPNNLITWNNPWAGFNFDSYYRNLSENGQTVATCIQGNVAWASNGDWSKLAGKPISKGESPTNPASYIEHANFMYQIAARYGSKVLPDSLLKLKSDQERFSGKNQIKYFEDWNEQNKDWKGFDGWFSPYDYAAMASADYDGHQKTMGTRIGVKNADPDAKLVMGGLAGISLDYIKSMKLWFDVNRTDSVFPLDAINVHTYATNESASSIGISPEAYNLKGRMEKIVDYRNKYLHNKEVWISEFGYDTHPNSPIRAPQIGNCSQKETQARWLIRSFLELAASGVDKAIVYSLADVDSLSAIQYSTSGLVGTKNTSYAPKPAWYYLYTLKNRLGNFRYVSEENSGNPNVKVYKFAEDSTHRIAYAVWCPTASDLVVSDYQLAIDASCNQAKLVTLEYGSTTGNESSLPINGGKVSLNVTEKTAFVIASTDTIFPIMPVLEKRIMLNTSMVVNESNHGNATLLADEQDACGDPLNGVYAAPKTYWFPSYHAEDYPSSAYIDLGTERDISKIFLFDAHDCSKIDISIGTPGNWSLLFKDTLDNFLTWRCYVVNTRTRYLRLTSYGSGNVNEIVLYGK